MSRKKVAIPETFSGIARRIRKVRGKLSQESFGALLGVKKSTISRYEAGRIPNLGMLKKIAEISEVTLELLLKGESAGAAPLAEHAPEAYAARSASLDADIFARIMVAARSYLLRHRRQLSPLGEAGFYIELYQYWLDEKELPDDQVMKAYLRKFQ